MPQLTLMAVLPDLLLVLTLFGVLMADLFLARALPSAPRILAVTGAALTLILLFALPTEGGAWAGYAVTPAGRWWRTAFVLFLLFAQMTGGRDLPPGSRPREGAYQTLLLGSTLGMCLLVSSREWLVFFLGLELATLPLMALSAFLSRQALAVEAAIKFTIAAGLAMAMSAFGISFVYGAAGGTSFTAAARAAQNPEVYLVLGGLWVAGALLFKVAAFPFHLWAPDVYQGVRYPVMAMLATASKAAGLAALAVVFFGPLSALRPRFETFFLLAALVTQVVGSLGALRQERFGRFMAYSSIAQAGVFLLVLLGPTQGAHQALLFNVFAYGLATWLLVYAWSLARRDGRDQGDDSLHELAGLGRRQPVVALAMTAALLSLAGLPPLAGFLGKYLLFTGLAARGQWVALAMSLAHAVLSLYYYARWVGVLYRLPQEARDGSASQAGAVPAVESAPTPLGREGSVLSWTGMALLLVWGMTPLLLGALKSISR